MPERVDPRDLPLGLPRLHLRETDSTNARARELAGAGAPHGTTVTAGYQTAGRGRQGRTWSAPPGHALLVSVVLRRWPRLLPLASAVAVADVVGADARIKWPNDVLVDGRKVAGILVEARPQEHWAIVGIGLNVAVVPQDLPPELHATAAGLGLEPADVEPTLQRLLRELELAVELEPEDLLERWRARDVLRGRPISWAAGNGTATGIDAEGRLLVDVEGGGRVALDAGEVHLGTRPH
jgi:BirA family biotin operon repressor/biotin-[acetyl-CoA-carboxylase] ligase